MQLSILSPTSKKTYDIQWIEVNTDQGNFVIQANHAPMILSLSERKPVIFCHISGAQETIEPVTAIIHVTRSSVTLLIT